MQILDFRTCLPRKVVPFWTACEKEIRHRDPRLWVPRDLERQLQWLYQDMRGEPGIVGRIASQDDNTIGMLMVARRQIAEIDVIRAIYPRRFAFCSWLAVDRYLDTNTIIKNMLDSAYQAQALADLSSLFIAVPTAAVETLKALEEDGLRSWIMMAHRDALPYEPPDFEGKVRAASLLDREAIIDLSIEMIEFHREIDPRCSTDADLKAIYQAELNDAFADLNHAIFVAELNGKVVGEMHCVLHRLNEEERSSPISPGTYGYIGSASVTASVRGKGVGKALFAQANRWFRSHRVNGVQLHYNTVNPVSTHFWQNLGFEPLIVTLHQELTHSKSPET